MTRHAWKNGTQHSLPRPVSFLGLLALAVLTCLYKKTFTPVGVPGSKPGATLVPETRVAAAQHIYTVSRQSLYLLDPPSAHKPSSEKPGSEPPTACFVRADAYTTGWVVLWRGSCLYTLGRSSCNAPSQKLADALTLFCKSAMMSADFCEEGQLTTP